MALQASGQISLNELHVEAGGSSGTECTFNDSDIRSLIGKATAAQMGLNEWYGASAATAPVWSTSNKTFDLGTPDVVETYSGNFTLSQGGSVAIIAIGGGGGGSKNSYGGLSGKYHGSGGGGGGVAIKGIIGTSGQSFTASAGSSGAGFSASSPNLGNGSSGGTTTVTGTGVSLTANGGQGGVWKSYTQNAQRNGGSASGGDANYTGGYAANPPTSDHTVSGGGGAGGGNSPSTSVQYPAGGTSPLKTGALSSYVGNGGAARARGGYPKYYGAHGGSYGGGGGAGHTNDTGANRSHGGNGGAGRIIVMYWN